MGMIKANWEIPDKILKKAFFHNVLRSALGICMRLTVSTFPRWQRCSHQNYSLSLKQGRQFTPIEILVGFCLKVGIEISVDHQTILKPSALLKMKVHPKLCQNVAILRSIVGNQD